MITSYRQLPIGKYHKIMELCRDESLPQFNMQLSVFSVLSGIPEDTLLDMPIADFREIAAKSAFLEKDIPDMKGHKAAAIYRTGKWELVPCLYIKKITTAQYVDFQTFCKEDGHVAKLLSCFLIPKGCTYNSGYDISEVHNALEENMSIYDAAQLSAFFFEEISAFNQGYPNLFNTGCEETAAEDGNGDYGEIPEDEGGFNQRWGWIANVDAVSELVRCPWSAVWEMSITEFFNLLSYRKDKIEHDRRELEKWRRTH